MRHLPYARNVSSGRNVGFPTGGDPQGYGVPIVVVGVTPHQGKRENRLQGEGAQVPAAAEKGGGRNAKRQNFRAAICGSLRRSGTGERDAGKRACPVRGGADGKGLTTAPRLRPTPLRSSMPKISVVVVISSLPSPPRECHIFTKALDFRTDDLSSQFNPPPITIAFGAAPVRPVTHVN